MDKVKKKTSKKKWNFEQFELVRVVWDDATADESWMGLEDADKLADAEIESYGMFLRVRGKYLYIQGVSYPNTTAALAHLFQFLTYCPMRLLSAPCS